MQWLKYIGLRLGVAALLIGLGIALVKLPQSSAKKIGQQQTAAAAQARKQAQDIREVLHTLPEPSQTRLQAVPDAKNFAKKIQSEANSYEPAKLKFPSPGWLILSLPYDRKVSSAKRAAYDHDLKALYGEVNSTLKKTDQLLDYHGSVMRALANVLDYSPDNDLDGFDLSNPQIVAKLEAAGGGIGKAEDTVTKLRGQYTDAELGQLITILRGLQQTISDLRQQGNLPDATQQFLAQQKELVSNRQRFWEKAKSDLNTKLLKAEQLTVKIRERWAEP